jgi:hypothetical protein
VNDLGSTEPDRGRKGSASHYDQMASTLPLVGKACPRSQRRRLDSRPFLNKIIVQLPGTASVSWRKSKPRESAEGKVRHPFFKGITEDL